MQICQYFLDSLHYIYYIHSGIYDNHTVLGDFDLNPSHTQLSAFMEDYNFYNFMKNNTCFKGDSSCIDLTLTNRKYCVRNTSSFETGISVHHRLIYSMLKTTFEKKNQKKLSTAIIRSWQAL